MYLEKMMQVSGTNDTNCAIVGGQKAIEFQIANSPEFFNILSSSLYANPIKAIVREIICNAWDAHVQSDITEPVRVSLNDEDFIVQDFGSGIPKNKIQEIYGTYGLSTKTACSNQTGGFGLGCKSPFAYADNFEVTSCCEGIKTIYQMKKASDSTDGKPAIVSILSVPTEETGLTVKIPLKSLSDYTEFQRAINDVLYYSEKDTKFNNVVVSHLPNFKKFIFVNPTVNTAHLPDQIAAWIKYGDVIYPLKDGEEYSYHHDLNYLLRFTERLSIYRRNTRVIIKAPANSLTITPSREELRYTEQNQEVISKLLKSVIHDIYHGYKAKIEPYAIEAVKAYKKKWTDYESANLLYRFKEPYKEQEFYEEHEIHKYFYALIGDWHLDDYIQQTWMKNSSFRRSLEVYRRKKHYYRGKTNYLPWFMKHMTRTISKKLESVGLSPSKLSVYYIDSWRYINESLKLDPESHKSFLSMDNVLSLMDPVVYVGHGAGKIRAHDENVPQNFLFYKCSSKTTKPKIIEKLKSLGYEVREVISLIPKRTEQADKTYEHTNLAEGSVSWSRGWSAAQVCNSLWWEDNLEELKNGGFKAIGVVNRQNASAPFEGFSNTQMKFIADTYAKDILIVKTKADAKFLKKKLNLLSVPEFITNEIKKLNHIKSLKLTPPDSKIVELIIDTDNREGVETLIDMCRKSKGKVNFGYDFLKNTSGFESQTIAKLYNCAKTLGVEDCINFYMDPSVKKFIKDMNRNNIGFLPRKYRWVYDGNVNKADEQYIRYNILKRTLK